MLERLRSDSKQLQQGAMEEEEPAPCWASESVSPSLWRADPGVLQMETDMTLAGGGEDMVVDDLEPDDEWQIMNRHWNKTIAEGGQGVTADQWVATIEG